MRSQKKSRFFLLGRKWVFTLALFLLVFAAASVMKIQAGTSDSGSGWLWGGSDDGAGNNTGVGWISMNNTNPGAGGSVDYGVNIPSGNGDVTGYTWSENIGWISFNAADLVNCPQNPCGAARVVGNNLIGWARIIGIKTEFEKVPSNSGGWNGWISLSGPHYGVRINADNTLTGYAWSASSDGTPELGWIDFSRAKVKVCASITCATKTPCEGVSLGATGSACDGLSFCGSADAICTLTSGTTWTCSDGCGTTLPECSASIQPKVDGECNSSINGKALCDRASLSESDLCSKGTAINVIPSPLSLDSYDISWDCGGTCGGTTASCSAKGKKSCGWKETNP